jgi:ribosomal protein S18 acetylase RimI-like enzyme
MDSEEISIRPYRPDDLEDLYRVCLLTARDGGDATSLYRDPRLPGLVYAAPYGLFEPSLAFVAVDAEGVGGYILGALDSRAFEDRLERDWWPQLRRRYPEPAPESPERPWTQDQTMAHQFHHRWPLDDELIQLYPSHLHIDLLPRLQARGQGRLLITTLLGELRARGSRGVHLNVNPGNQRAAAFYEHLGFTERPATDVRVFVMKLAAAA